MSEMEKYFGLIEKEVNRAYDAANSARKNSLDPEDKVEIPLTKNIFERVERLVGVLKPELIDSGLAQRLRELDNQYGNGDWRVSLIIADEVSHGKFCKFSDDREAIEVGIRVGLAYATMGVVSAPLEGFIEFQIKKRMDNEDYGALYFAGPIRGAGGTAAALTLIIGDYLRRKFGLKAFDITDDEITRTKIECESYHTMVARLQYFPKNEELEFLLKRLPIEINGDPTSEREVIIMKDLPRVGTPRIRGGMCLVLCEGLAQKAKKMLKNIEKWGQDFGLEEWTFLKEYIELQKKTNAVSESAKKETTAAKLKPNFIYIDETVAGRPIFAYPLTKGGFRIRYGRSRLTGLAAAGINPATMRVLGNFIASGSQLRIELPGKACAVTPCSSIDGPFVKLADESVVQVQTEEEALRLKNNIKEILSLGDLLVCYGEFARNNHVLVPSPYCEEWWLQDLIQAAGPDFAPPKALDSHQMVEYSAKYGIPLHPRLLAFYSDIDSQSLELLARALSESKIEEKRIELKHDKTAKKVLETLCVPHTLTTDGIIIEGDAAIGLLWSLGYLPDRAWKLQELSKFVAEGKKPLEILNSISRFKIMDKSGTYIGARLGRPEKSKQRKLKGSPQSLFPVGLQGGRMRSLNEASSKGFVESEFPVFECTNCKQRDIYPRCNSCNSDSIPIRFCIRCKQETSKSKHCGTETFAHNRRKLDPRPHIDMALSKMGVSMPSLVKGVRGLSSERRIPEPIEKGILRAIHEVYVNKDGTIRFDAIETPITHFKPREVGTSVEQLKQLGYTHDINNKPLENENQVLEMFPQDIVLPDCKEWKDSSALDMLMKTCSFIDELLVKYYGKQKYYNVNSASDLVGHLIIGIAPHTSAGIIGRIIGFSKTQCFYAHPYFHSACRRNCVHPNTDLIIYDKKNNMVESKPIGPTIETLIKNGAKVKQDGDFSIIEAPEEWQVFSINPENHDVEQKQIRCFIKGPTPKNWVKIKTALGREFVMTPDHTFLYSTEEGELKSKAASEVAVGDRVPLNYKFNPPERRTDKINLIAEFLKSNNTKVLKEIKITGAERYFKGISKKVGIGKLRVMVPFSKQYSLTLSSWYKAVPLEHFDILLKNNICKIEDLPDGAQVSSWQTSLPIDLGISPELMRILGYYLSEGHTRENRSTHQISFRICQQDVFADMVNCLQKVFGLRPNISEGNTKASISTNIVYYIFTEIFKIGKGAKTKRVPSFVFNLNKELLSNFISAYFDGDGNVLDEPLRLQFYSTSQDLLNDIGIVLSRFGIMARYFEVQPRLPGKTLIKRYSDLGKEPGLFGLRHLTLGKADAILFSKICKPTNTSKRNRIENISKLDIESERYTKFQKQMIPLKEFCDFTSDIVKSVEEIKEDVNCYCLDIITDDKQIESKNVLWGNQLFQIRCDGDELAFILLVDALLNFSRHYLPDKRGSRYMDLPLVLTTRLDPQEVDDEVYNMDIADIYPTEFYKATLEFKSPYEVKVKQINSVLGKPEQYRGIMYTHPVESINFGNRVSSYKTLVTIFDKVQKQMELAEKTRAINKSDVARILIEKHFLKDIKGNLRKYSHQEFRCISCNTKYRRVPLVGRCNKCAGKLVLTVAEGTVSKYLEPSLVLAEKYSLPTYLRQTLDILKRKVDSVFGKEATKQVGLGSFVAE